MKLGSLAEPWVPAWPAWPLTPETPVGPAGPVPGPPYAPPVPPAPPRPGGPPGVPPAPPVTALEEKVLVGPVNPRGWSDRTTHCAAAVSGGPAVGAISAAPPAPPSPPRPGVGDPFPAPAGPAATAAAPAAARSGYVAGATRAVLLTSPNDPASVAAPPRPARAGRARTLPRARRAVPERWSHPEPTGVSGQVMVVDNQRLLRWFIRFPSRRQQAHSIKAVGTPSPRRTRRWSSIKADHYLQEPDAARAQTADLITAWVTSHAR